MKNIRLSESWTRLLGDELEKPYMKKLLEFLTFEAASEKKIFPAFDEVFEALNLTPFENVKVVIIGQDPYHGDGQAHGLCFSVRRNVPIPPSLLNIYKELRSDLAIEPAAHGCLENWAKQGVLLLNNVLTVEEGKAGSHHNQGWETFTDKIIEILNEKKNNLVFILWGAPAQKKAAKVDADRHFIIKSPHPSPLSSYRGFFGSRPFSQTNHFLKKNGLGEIDWSVR